MNTHVKEIQTAYADCNNLYGIVREVGYQKRNLNFCSTIALSLSEWRQAMTKALEGYSDYPSYNYFMPEHVEKAIRNAVGKNANRLKFYAAREGSVCLYIEGDGDILRALFNNLLDDYDASYADEIGFEPDGRLRLWWD